jgi:steroid delta-isomerase-like uncharacterized protein
LHAAPARHTLDAPCHSENRFEEAAMASRNADTFRAAHQAFNRRDFDAVAEMLTEDFTYEDRARGLTFTGRAGFKEFMQGWAAAFSDARVSEPTYADAGDVVIAQFTGLGTNDGSLGPLPATGRTMAVPFCEVLHFNERGLADSGAVYYDQLTMLTQLGHAQPTAAGTSSGPR